MEEWNRKLQEVTKAAWDDFHKMGLRPGSHEAEQFEKGVLARIAAWVKANPPPAQAVAKAGEGAKAIRSSAQVIEDLNWANRNAQAIKLGETSRMMGSLRRANGIRRNTEAFMNSTYLVGLVGSGGLAAGAVLVAKAVVKMLIEDMAISGTIKLSEYALKAYEQVTMPKTMREAEIMYRSYKENCTKVITYPVMSAPTVLHVPIKPKEIWLYEAYGIRWDALRP
jgi:hypothetical protein